MRFIFCMLGLWILALSYFAIVIHANSWYEKRNDACYAAVRYYLPRNCDSYDWKKPWYVKFTDEF